MRRQEGEGHEDPEAEERGRVSDEYHSDGRPEVPEAVEGVVVRNVYVDLLVEHNLIVAEPQEVEAEGSQHREVPEAARLRLEEAVIPHLQPRGHELRGEL